MPHFTKCRTNPDRRDVVRAADDAAEDDRSSHPHSRSARRHSQNAHRPSGILGVPRRVAVALPRVMREGHRRGAAPRARDRCVPLMRSARERPA